MSKAGASARPEAGWGPLGDIAAAAQRIGYPDGIVPVPFAIEGPASFPGGSGLIDQDFAAGSRLARGGIMVLSHNYGTCADHRRYAQRRGEVAGSVTWRHLRPLLREAGIAVEECFFTCAFMGLLQSGSNCGSPPGHRDLAFRDDCRVLLSRQIALQRPRLILSLGRFVPGFLASLSPDLTGWQAANGFRALDKAGPVRAARVAGHATIVVALVHPCYRHITAARRAYEGLAGHAAELAMVERGRGMAR